MHGMRAVAAWNAVLGAVLAWSFLTCNTAAAQSAPRTASATQTNAAVTPSPFALVVIDEATEKRLGSFPIDRAHVAKAIERLADANAKAVVLKFFYDQPAKTPASDIALVNAMKRTKVLLQARIDDNEPNPNKLPDRFMFNAPPGKVAVGGVSGWVPLPMFSALAHHVGFVDVQSFDRVPAYERYLDRNVKSLTVAALQAALDDAPLVIRPGVEVSIGAKRIAVDELNQIVVSAEAPKRIASHTTTSFIDLIEGRANAAGFANKVVVITYSGKQLNHVKTPFGEMTPHMIFWMGLLDAWTQLK
jgi:adenylate cyclase